MFSFKLPSQIASVLLLFILEPEARLNLLKVFKTISVEDKFDKKKLVSSAKADIKCISALQGDIMPIIDSLYLKFHRSVSITRTYSKGAIGQPCLTDLSIFIIVEVKPLTKILEYLFLYNIFIHFLKDGPNPKFSNTLNRYLCATQSNAFSWSTFKKMAGMFLHSIY